MTTTREGPAFGPFKQIKVVVQDRVAYVDLDNPPVNVLGAKLIAEIRLIADSLDQNPLVHVVVFRSSVPDFFIAHLDVEVCTNFPDGLPYEQTDLARFQQMIGRIRQMRKATIGQVTGRARGGGSEFLLALDLRYAADSAVFCQPEIGFDILPGGGGTQRLTQLIGRGRALEMMLTGRDVSAVDAERYGYLNQVVPVDELPSVVDAVARRIAHFSSEAIARIKACVDLAEPSLDAGLKLETKLFYKAIRASSTLRGMESFMANGGQTPATEKDLDATLGHPPLLMHPGGLAGA